MSKAEEFIQQNTKDCTNKSLKEGEYYLWLTPDEARKAVEIAREETIEKIKRLLKEKYLIKSAEPLRWVSWEKVFTDLKQAMKNE